MYKPCIHKSSVYFRLAIFASTLLATKTLVAQVNTDIDYARDVRPLLSRSCYVCHGPDPGSRQAGLRLDRADSALAALESGLVPIVPGSPENSEIIRRIVTKDLEERMPPAKSGHSLSEKEIGILRRWIECGARFDDHWSFRPPRLADPPDVRNASWARATMDRFILANLEQRGIAVSPEANKATLIRRLTFDLLGLPPRPEDVHRFVQDSRLDSYERLVDRLLASPRLGERWGRYWLDLAHYADSDGYLGDALRPSAWIYRDWVIEAHNNDMPFDQFTIEQLAGDLLPDATLSQKTATGFLRNTLRNTEAGVDLEEYRLKEIVDRVSTIGAGWLGLTLGCAECHSHKYDPISQREFYELFAFLNDADDVDLPITVTEEQERYQRAKENWENEDKILREAVNLVAVGEYDDKKPFDIEEWYSAISVESKKRNQEQKAIVENARRLESNRLRSALEAYEKNVGRRPKTPSSKIMTLALRSATRKTFVHLRGDYRNRGEEVTPGTPAVLPPLKSRAKPADRLDLARWLVDPANPLTARVNVNQIWARLLGRGLVASVDNFGAGGELPSHPELLDWLANEFVSRGWSRKEMMRMIVCSSTYRQSAFARDDLVEKDPLNTFFARQSRFRLEAELIRDNALASAGLLDGRIGGPGIRPPQPAYVTSISRNAEWNVTSGGEQYRRGLYIVFRRATPYPMLLTFDAPDSTIACTRRDRSNSPLQALTLLNDPVYLECAKALGHTMATNAEKSQILRLNVVFQRCLGREASAEELDRILEEFNKQYARLKANPESARAIVDDPAHDRSELPSKTNSGNIVEEATWVLIARILMNVDEFITRE